MLEPLAWLNQTGEYSRRFDWLYLSLSLAVLFLSLLRQRKAFYFAGLLNTGAALWWLTEHYEWFDRPSNASSTAAARNGVPPMFVRPIAAPEMPKSPDSTTAATPTIAQSCARRWNFW